MIAALYGTGEYLTAVLAGAPATTQPTFNITYREREAIGNPVGSLTGTTAKTILEGVAGIQREVDCVHIYNGDTQSVSVTVSKVSGGSTYNLVNVTLPVGATLRWTRENGVQVISSGGTTPSAEVGTAVANNNVVATESGSGNFRKTLLTLTATPITITDALAYANVKLYDFPAGRIRILDCLTSLAFTTTSVIASTLNSGVTVSYGIGSAVASATTLATTMMNMMPGSGETVKSFTSSTTINVASAGVTGILAAVSAAQLGAILDGTSTAIDAYLNVAVPTGTDIDADATLTVTGTVQLTWINAGDI